MIRVILLSVIAVFATTTLQAQQVKISTFSGFERAQIVYENFDEPDKFKNSYGTANVSLITTGFLIGIENRFTDFITVYYSSFSNHSFDPRQFDDDSFIGDFIVDNGYSFGVGIENEIHTFIKSKNGSRLFLNAGGSVGVATMRGMYRYEAGLNEGRTLRENRFEFSTNASLDAEVNLGNAKLAVGYSPIGFRMGYLRNSITYNGVNVSLFFGK